MPNQIKNNNPEETPLMAASPQNDAYANDELIAVIGMSCRFPGGANDIDSFWSVLEKGIDGIVEVPEERWETDRYFDKDGSVLGKMYCKHFGFLDKRIDEFDARLFNISPIEAQAMDPQQRLLLELTWEAFENACLDITRFKGSDTGVYVGISNNDYMLSHLYSGDLSRIDAYALTGIHFSVACGRLSYTFGFEGPSISVDTACSSSMSALHLACTALKAGEISMAVVAGVNLMLAPPTNIAFTALRAISPDGHCKTFDDSADGYGRGEGGGVVLVKKLSKAIADQDQILGVIRATGINQDGMSNGLTAPNGASQAELFRKTLHKAQLVPKDISYIEMHGTGTKLGDPIEVSSVAKVYGIDRDAGDDLKIGSVKSNIGHLEPAAGMASLMKVLLAMKHSLIPGNLHFTTPNRFIRWDKIPVRVVGQHTAWETGGVPKRAAINSFGFGGSNAHVIVEEYAENDCSASEEGGVADGLHYILKLSAKSEKDLRKYAALYARFIEERDDLEFSDIIYSANRGRPDFDHRLAAVGKTRDEIIHLLKSFLAGVEDKGLISNVDRKLFKSRKLVFMFTGQGSQYINMGKALYESNLAFRAALTECDALFQDHIGQSVITLLYGADTNDETITKTVYAQALIFSVEYALCQLWQQLCVVPDIVMGHSIGEYAAAVAAGIMTLADAVRLVAIRGRLMDETPGKGAMATVFADEATIGALIVDQVASVSIAVRNNRNSCVVSGESGAVADVLRRAEEHGIRTRQLQVSHGFHSHLMEPILPKFFQAANEVSYAKAKTPFVSAMLSRTLQEDEILDAAYWTRHIREKVDFYQALTSLDPAEEYFYLEIGSDSVLTALCKMTLDEDVFVAGTLRRKEADGQQAGEAIAALYVAHIPIDWRHVVCYGRQRWRKVALPHYPYDKKVFWTMPQYHHELNGQSPDGMMHGKGHALLGQRLVSYLMKDAVVFQRRFTVAEPYFMKEHILFNVSISPAAAYISMILSAVKEVWHPAACKLKAMEFRVPLVISGDERRLVQICLNKRTGDRSKFQLVSRDEKDETAEWVLHTQGEIELAGEYTAVEEKLDIAFYKTRQADAVSPEDGVYALMKHGGFDLGDSFRRIKASYSTTDGCVCLLQPDGSVPQLETYEIYPGMIDSVLQAPLCALLPEMHRVSKEDGNYKAVVPYYIQEVAYNFRDANDLWVHSATRIEDNMVNSDIGVYNDSEELVMKMSMMIAKMTERDIMLREITSGFKDLYYRIVWKERPTKKKEADYADTYRYILIADNDDDAANALWRKLSDVREDVVYAAHERSCYRHENDCRYVVDFDDAVSVDRLLRGLLSDDQPLRVLYCRGLSGGGQAFAMDATHGLLTLLTVIGRLKATDKVKLKIVTHGVHSPSENVPFNLLQSPLWGFAKVLSIELSNVYDGIIDTDSDSLVGGALTEELQSDGTEEVLLVGGKRYVSRLSKVKPSRSDEPSAAHAPITIDSGATYLITGGTGALGVIYARQLILKGAKHLILLSRRAPNGDVLDVVNRWRSDGVEITFAQADIGDASALRAAIDANRDGVRVIKGVIHAAGVLKDGLILDQTIGDFDLVATPKILGAVNVYNALDRPALDFFVMLSSAASVLGNIGQNGYAAANYFLNRFAAQLQKDGIAAYTVCWGPWSAGGMASGSKDIADNIDAMGLIPISTELGGQIIGQLFVQPVDDLVIIDAKLEKMAQGKSVWQAAFLEDLLSGGNSEESRNKADVAESVRAMPRDQMKAYLVSILQQKCGKIMGLDTGQLAAADLSFREQGIDSLMIFSLCSEINKTLAVSLDISIFINYPTIAQMADYLAETIAA